MEHSTFERGTRANESPVYNQNMLSIPEPLTRIQRWLFSAGQRSVRVPSRASHLHPRLRARIRWLRVRLVRVPGMELAWRTWRELGDDHAIDLAAAIAYYSVLSLFPLAIGLVSLFSLVLESEAVEREVHNFFNTYLPGSHGILTANVEAVHNIRGVLGIFSIVGLMWSSTLLFGAVTRAVNRAWDIDHDRPFYIEKPRHILMAMSVAPLFIISLVLTTGLQVLGSENIPVLGRLAFLEHNGINALVRPVPFVFSLIIFLLIYKFTPMVRTYWRFVWPGAILAALLFEAAKSFFVFYLENYAAFERIYGTLTSVIVLLAWTYLSGFIVVIGAEVSSEYYRIRMGGVRGRPIAFGRRRRSLRLRR